jgi:hypothetical protein
MDYNDRLCGAPKRSGGRSKNLRVTCGAWAFISRTASPSSTELVGLMPHMHVRGKAARFDLRYPDGRTETILNVPRYDFNWQLAPPRAN